MSEVTVKLANTGKVALGTETATSFDVICNGEKVGVAYRHEAGTQRGNYSFGAFVGSRARLIAHVS